ncbi:hypothetical protein BJ684DRAFT_21495 [Piptocephalis cylindrospora]|uniref:Uncharacterized protein n=1 Tax=Piptocephalis cylindrospora TaxID=1907219 RepID=A0A4V1IXR0_9FUNG|nr:hypothetical protein BJ684DRAFT_21495 [Piptocephalis cylindrospora]|eukprot:RKP11929.1 hypothetical protein BJ684DRAFT_21495 [Piptocephalis cylindrospora]
MSNSKDWEEDLDATAPSSPVSPFHVRQSLAFLQSTAGLEPLLWPSSPGKDPRNSEGRPPPSPVSPHSPASATYEAFDSVFSAYGLEEEDDNLEEPEEEESLIHAIEAALIAENLGGLSPSPSLDDMGDKASYAPPAPPSIPWIYKAHPSLSYPTPPIKGPSSPGPSH